MNNVYTILVADDDPTAQLLMQASLEIAGFNVIVAENGKQTLEIFRRQHCDMVMLDVEMPDMSGYDLCELIRQQKGEEFPIIMVTSMEDAGSVEHAFEVGATDFIAKPINWTLLAHRVKYVRRSSQSATELISANQRHSAILAAIPDLLLEADDTGTILDMHSPQYEASPFFGVESLIGKNVESILPSEAAAHCLAAVNEAADKGYAKGFQFQYTMPSGPIWFELSVSRKEAKPGEASRFIVLARDITDRKQAEQRITELAYFDGLTMLPNRRSFMDRLSREISRASVGDGRLAILFLDLDGFKSVNDTMGHDCGDLVLRLSADRLRDGLRAHDVVARASENPAVEVELARLGGDEFTALISDLASAADALAIAQRIRELLALPFTIQGRQISITSSIGIALFPDDGTTATELLKHADTAMYHAKNEGRNNCQFYSSLLTRRVHRQLELSSSVPRALTNNEFKLHYQPQMNLRSGSITSVEALIRWNHPEHGMIEPGEFLPVVESNGLILPIGEWVLRTACTDAAAWARDGRPLKVAVNISTAQFMDPGLHTTIQSLLQETGLSPELLELEITERTLMDGGQLTRSKLQALKDLGIQLALDDFGTGYSSFSHLKSMPIDSLKIDGAIIAGLSHDRDNLVVVSAILSLANHFGLRVTAEGVETDEQIGILQQLDCDLVQGYLLSHPVPVTELAMVCERLRFFVLEKESTSLAVGAAR